jgi:MFS family permease
MLCLGSSISILVVGRILAGVSAAVVYTSGLALLVDTVGKEEIGAAMGWVGLSISMGFVTGPLLGGLVFDAAGAWGVFGITMGMLLWDFILRILLVEKRFAKEWDGNQRRDEEEALIPSYDSDTSTTCGTYGSSDASSSIHENQQKWPAQATPASFLLLKSPRLLAALYGMFVQTALVVSFDTVFPLFAKQTFGWTSSGAGLLFLMVFLPSTCSPLVGMLADRRGPKWIAVTALVMSAPPLLLLRLVTHGSTEQVVLMCFLLVLIGLLVHMECVDLRANMVVGFTSSSICPPLMSDITWVVKDMETNQPGVFGAGGAFAQAWGLFNAAVAAGALVGPVWSGFFQEKLGWKAMTLSLALLMLSGVVPVVCLFFFMGRS